MTKHNSNKRLQAINTMFVWLAPNFTREQLENSESETLYETLENGNFIWHEKTQSWEKRKYKPRRDAKRSIVKENSFVLIRIMARKEILDNDRESFALAFEAIGYEIVAMSEPEENRENGFYRIYIKAHA